MTAARVAVSGDPLAFVERPIAAALAAGTILLWLSPLVTRFIRRRSA